MAEDKITAAETANEGTKKSENIVELAKPYVFEGKEYGEIDLTGLEKLTVQDAMASPNGHTAPARQSCWTMPNAAERASAIWKCSLIS